MFYVGLLLSTMSLFSLVLVLGIYVFYDYIAQHEERVLVKRYGKPYRDYMRATGKWFPRKSELRFRT
jgi:protein-S-isoprenylcysteine O-methyltransferase Ste14